MSITHNGITYRVADAHTHIYPDRIAARATAGISEFYELPVAYAGTARKLLEIGGAAGVERYLVCAVATKLEQMRSISAFLASACEAEPAFVGLGAWHPDATDIGAAFDHIESLGLRGIKLHPDFQRFYVDAPHMLAVYREAARRRLVVLFHSGDDRTDYSTPTRLAHVVDQVPELVCIAAHLGGWRAWREAMDVLRGANVYVDTCSSLFFLPPEEALASIRHFGAAHTLFGTDFPMWAAANELDRFFALGLEPEENRRILYDNFAALFPA